METVNTNANVQDLVYRLRKRAEIRRQIPGRKSVQEGKPDRIADILEEAANEIDALRGVIDEVSEFLPHSKNLFDKIHCNKRSVNFCTYAFKFIY